MNNKIKFVALGGMDERGKDCYVLDIDDNLFVINAGISFLSTSTLGVSGLIPDYQYLEENRAKIRGIFVGSANEDNIGGLAFLNRKLENVPVFTSGVNVEIITDYFPNDNFNFKEIKPNQGIDFNGIKITFFRITSSIPGSCGIIFQTSFGSNIVYLDDTVIGATNMPALNNDLIKMFGTLYGQNNYLLTKTGYISTKTGFNAPRYSVQNFFNKVLGDNNGRIITALYSYDIYKLIVLMIIAAQKGRPIILFNAQTDNLVGALAQEKFINEKLLSVISDVENADKLNNAIICIVNEPNKIFEQLETIMEGQDELVQIKESDVFVFASSTMNGWEKKEADLFDEMNKLKAKVVKIPSDVLDIKSCTEDCKFIAGMLKPKYIIPLGGLYMDFANYSNNISKIGFDKKNILILDNGAIASFANDEYLGAKQFINLEAKPINIQGNIDSGANSLYERKQMQSSGIVLSNFLINNKDKKIIRADFEPIGVIDLNKENSAIISAINEDVSRDGEKLLAEFTQNSTLDTKEFKMAIRKVITKYYDKKFSKKPLVMCTLLFDK